MKIRTKTPKLVFCLCAVALGLAGGTAQAYNVSGTVTDSTNGTTFYGTGLVTITVKNSLGATEGSTVTAANGTYSITGLAIGDYTVSPSLSGFTFSPTAIGIDFSLESGSASNVNFSVAHSISGKVSFNGTGLDGTVVTADGFSATTDTNGNYTITGVPAGTFATMPALSGNFFIPPSQNVPLGPNATGINFAPYPSGIYIGGQITSGTNDVSGVLVSAGTNQTTTGANGYYAFSNLLGTYVVTPSQTGQVFNPQHQTLTASLGLTNINFMEGVSNITTIVATCDESSLAAAVALGGLIEFGCDGNVYLTGNVAGYPPALTITNNVVLDGTNHQVTLYGLGLNGPIAAILNSNVTVGLNNLVLTGGFANQNDGFTFGAGGAICNGVDPYAGYLDYLPNDVLNIYGCTFYENTSYDTSAYGGAICNGGTLNVVNSTFLNNSIGVREGSQNEEGSAIFNFGNATISGSTFANNAVDNTGSGGGTIFEDGGTLVLANCTFASNYVYCDVEGGDYGDGSAVFNFYGGGVVITNCTFLGNYTTLSSLPESVLGGSNFTVRACAFGQSYDNIFDNNAAFVDGGYNIALPSLGTGNSFTNVTSRSGIDPMLGPLASNGGPTMTCPPLPGSLCIDAITNGPYPPTDQRGFTRPNGKGASIGAVEYYTTDFTITSLTRTNTNWKVQGKGLPLTAYQLLSSTNLTNWSVVETNATGSNGLFNALDTSSNAPRRFYRTSAP